MGARPKYTYKAKLISYLIDISYSHLGVVNVLVNALGPRRGGAGRARSSPARAAGHLVPAAQE